MPLGELGQHSRFLQGRAGHVRCGSPRVDPKEGLLHGGCEPLGTDFTPVASWLRSRVAFNMDTADTVVLHSSGCSGYTSKTHPHQHEPVMLVPGPESCY